MPAPGTGDHPRSRGVYSAFTAIGFSLRGSSPLARGLPAALGLSLLEVRIIPARAGFTERVCYARSRQGIIPARAGFTPETVGGVTSASDHPRSRGVYVPYAPVKPQRIGSSPLARGLRADLPVLADVVRIIPARAGFT